MKRLTKHEAQILADRAAEAFIDDTTLHTREAKVNRAAELLEIYPVPDVAVGDACDNCGGPMDCKADGASGIKLCRECGGK